MSNFGEQRVRRMLSERGMELSEDENALLWDSDPQSMSKAELDKLDSLNIRIGKMMIDYLD